MLTITNNLSARWQEAVLISFCQILPLCWTMDSAEGKVFYPLSRTQARMFFKYMQLFTTLLFKHTFSVYWLTVGRQTCNFLFFVRTRCNLAHAVISCSVSGIHSWFNMATKVEITSATRALPPLCNHVDSFILFKSEVEKMISSLFEKYRSNDNSILKLWKSRCFLDSKRRVATLLQTTVRNYKVEGATSQLR